MDEKEFYENLKEELKKIIYRHNIGNDEINVIFVRPLTPEQVIGKPKRKDFPLLKGKEFMIEAVFKNSKGQAFTDSPSDFKGTTLDLLKLSLSSNSERAVFIASFNAIMRYFNYVSGTVHCKNEEPDICSDRLLNYITERFGKPKIAFIGLQPAMVGKLSRFFEMKVVDLDLDNIGKEKFGLKILGPEKTEEVISWGDIIATGSTAVNGSIVKFIREKPVIYYGVTGAAVCALFGFSRFCPYSKN